MAKKNQTPAPNPLGTPGERSLDLNEAVSSGLISKFSDRGAAGGLSRLDFITKQGAGAGIFKPESFYTKADTDYTNKLLGLYSANAKRGWAQRNTKAILKEQKERTTQMRDTGRRELGEKKASAQRLSRITGGLLSGASSPSLGESQTTGPMLGADSMLGQESMLGSRRRM
jgi:hypothetical protein